MTVMSASRFFSAFYRWNKHTQQPKQCTISSSYSRHIPARPTPQRKYHVTRLLHQQQFQNEGSHEAGNAENTAETLRKDVRNLMRKVPSSVAVITVASTDAELNKNVPMGVAVSSLSTVSLDPPTISFNIKHPSKTLDAIKATKGLFRVHFPAENRGGASMVHLFCHGNHPDAYAARRRGLRLFVPGIDPHTEKLRTSASNAPQIFGDSVRAAMECTLTHEFKVGDHIILVASVDKIEANTSDLLTILYVDGMYMRPNGTQIFPYGTGAMAVPDDWSAWDYPLFPGDAERRDYVQRIKDIVKADSRLLHNSKDTLRDLERTLAFSPGMLGINLEKIIDEVRQESSKLAHQVTRWEHLSLLSDFYGRLSPSDKAKIYERARNLVGEDARFLSLNYRIFLQHLGVSTSSIGLLPSDILGSLRDAGLVGPIQPRKEGPSMDNKDYNIVYLEQVEHRINEYLATLGYEEAAKTRLEDVVVCLGEQRSVSTYFKKARTRLLTDMSPHLFNSIKMDISGHVSPQEACVVMSRIAEFLRLGNYRKPLNFDPVEVLRRIRVHPTITGLDVEFFFGNLRRLYYSTRYSRDVAGRIEEVLKSWFASSTTWAEFEARVKGFVHKTPARAMTWSNRDKLAAMGLSWHATLDVPISEKKQPLNRGYILDTLVAKELKSLYGKSTPDVNEAIARYLQEQYGFDIKAGPVSSYSAVDAQTRTSHDEMHDAMLASRNIDVLAKKGRQAWLPHDGEEADDGLGAGPRIRFTSPRSSQIDARPSEQQGEKIWTGYSFAGARTVG